jgi:hypothetical protein
MRSLKNYISLSLPNSMCLCSTANEDMTDSSIEEMGRKLA